MTVTKTKAEQRIEQLIAISDRPLTDEESNELYKALHADYMRRWRMARAAAAVREMGRFALSERQREERLLLRKMRQEMAG